MLRHSLTASPQKNLTERAKNRVLVANIATGRFLCHNEGMADRQTINASLPPAMGEWVRAQVDSGRYRTVSEVMRDGVRLLQEAEHRRLIEKWMLDDLSADEAARLPTEMKTQIKDHFARLIDDARADVDSGRVVDGPKAMKQIEERIRERLEREP